MQTDYYSLEYYDSINKDEQEQAYYMAQAIVKLYRPLDIMDVGCATGLYMKPLIERGVTAFGIDSSSVVKDPRIVQVDPVLIKIEEARTYTPLRKYDVAICLETLEHIPEEHADMIVRTLSLCSDILVLSAARPGQPGEHHHNCQEKSYWLKKLSSYGYIPDDCDSQLIIKEMQKGHHTNWLQNIFVVKKF